MYLCLMTSNVMATYVCVEATYFATTVTF